MNTVYISVFRICINVHFHKKRGCCCYSRLYCMQQRYWLKKLISVLFLF